MLSVEERLMKKKAREFKKLIVGTEPIKEKYDYFMTGIHSLHAGCEIVNEYLQLTSTDADDFEQSKEFVISVLEKEIANFKNVKFGATANVIQAEFGRKGE